MSTNEPQPPVSEPGDDLADALDGVRGPEPVSDPNPSSGDVWHYADHGVAGGFPHRASDCTPPAPSPSVPESEPPFNIREASGPCTEPEDETDEWFVVTEELGEIVATCSDENDAARVALALCAAGGYQAEHADGQLWPADSPAPSVPESGRADRGDEVQIDGHIGNIVRVNDREGTCEIAWWMPTGGPYGSATSVDVPLACLHVRQQATTSRPTPSLPDRGDRLDELRALSEAAPKGHWKPSAAFPGVGCDDRWLSMPTFDNDPNDEKADAMAAFIAAAVNFVRDRLAASPATGERETGG